MECQINIPKASFVSYQMQIFVKTLSGHTITIDVNSATTIGGLKSIIEQRELVPVYFQRLIYSGRQYDNDTRTLKECGIGAEATVHLMLRVHHNEPICIKLNSTYWPTSEKC